MQVRVEDLSSAQQPVLGGDGLLDLHDHVGLAVHGLRVGHDARAGSDIVGVGDAAAKACAGLDKHFVAP